MRFAKIFSQMFSKSAAPKFPVDAPYQRVGSTSAQTTHWLRQRPRQWLAWSLPHGWPLGPRQMHNFAGGVVAAGGLIILMMLM